MAMRAIKLVAIGKPLMGNIIHRWSISRSGAVNRGLRMANQRSLTGFAVQKSASD
jgi:hypothetical protein